MSARKAKRELRKLQRTLPEEESFKYGDLVVVGFNDFKTIARIEETNEIIYLPSKTTATFISCPNNSSSAYYSLARVVVDGRFLFVENRLLFEPDEVDQAILEKRDAISKVDKINIRDNKIKSAMWDAVNKGAGLSVVASVDPNDPRLRWNYR